MWKPYLQTRAIVRQWRSKRKWAKTTDSSFHWYVIAGFEPGLWSLRVLKEHDIESIDVIYPNIREYCLTLSEMLACLREDKMFDLASRRPTESRTLLSHFFADRQLRYYDVAKECETFRLLLNEGLQAYLTRGQLDGYYSSHNCRLLRKLLLSCVELLRQLHAVQRGAV